MSPSICQTADGSLTTVAAGGMWWPAGGNEIRLVRCCGNRPVLKSGGTPHAPLPGCETWREEHSGEVRFVEDEYLRYHLAHSSLPLKGAFFLFGGTLPEKELFRGIYRKRAGIVITASKSQPLKG